MLPNIIRIATIAGGLFLAWLFIALSESNYLIPIWGKIFHEVGFGLIVAELVWFLFEFRIALENDRVWSDRIDRMTKGAFQAVLQRDLPKSLLDEAFNLVLDSKLIRENMSISYTLTEATVTASPDITADCVQMGAVVSFSMKNVAATAQKFPIRIRLPNPVHPKLKELSRVISIEITKEGVRVPLDLHVAEMEFRAALNDEQQTSVVFSAGEVDLAPNQKLDYRAEYVMAKESEDTEMFQTFYPCDGLNLTITDQCRKRKRLIFARSVHRRYIEADAPKVAPGTRNLRIADYLLPQQGFLVWWKHAPDDVRPPAMVPV